MTADERRGEQRIPVEMWVEELLGDDRYFQRSANLSLGGIYLEGTIPHPRGTIVNLKFTLPGDAEAVAVRGEIVGEPDEERLGMNVKFLDVEGTPGLMDRLKSFLEKSS